MTYEEARQYYDGLSARGIELGLTAVKKLLERLGSPQQRLRVIHIAGTNGKGSVLSYLSAILREAGYRTGTYSSPAVFGFREQFQAGGQPIGREIFAQLTGEIRREADRLWQEGTAVTAYEAQTALAFLWFARTGCDYVVVETGMGGRLDATNVLERVCLSVFASISMDHMGFLGDTLEDIACQKAGILKAGCPAVTVRQQPEAAGVLEEAARRKGCPLVTAALDRAWDIRYGLQEQTFSYRAHSGREYRELRIRQAGTYQVENAVLAAEAADILMDGGLSIREEHIRRGLEESFWPGRFTVLQEHPAVVLDGAHNEAGALRLRESLEQYFPGRKLVFIMGIFRDKEYDKIASIMAPLASAVYTVRLPGSSRMLEAEALRDAVRRALRERGMEGKVPVRAAAIAEAVRESLHSAGRDGVVVAFGSLSHLGELRRQFLAAQERGEDMG